MTRIDGPWAFHNPHTVRHYDGQGYGETMTEATEATLQDVEAFVARCQAVLDAHREKNFPTLDRKVLVIQPGRRYFKIVESENGEHRSVWAFVDKNGDVLKPASWRAPAKHARGNIFDDNEGMGSIGPYGPAYLK